jgi:SAM-dependent methyltransferase
VSTTIEHNWPVLLFSKSVLKQQKFEKITGLLGETAHLHCLDIGSDNGVISYLLRARGGTWKSADLDATAVASIYDLVKHNAFQIDGRRTPFHDAEFDRVVIVDFLEHIPTDQEFIDELFRIIKPDGELIVNVPHVKNSLLRKLRVLIGQTDEKHGHLRPGYTLESLATLLAPKFIIVSSMTYSKFFSECIDTLITLAFGLLKNKNKSSAKGTLVIKSDLVRYKKMFTFYSYLYPFVWCLAKLDKLLVWHSGYTLIVKAKVGEKHMRESALQLASSEIGKML